MGRERERRRTKRRVVRTMLGLVEKVRGGGDGGKRDRAK